MTATHFCFLIAILLIGITSAAFAERRNYFGEGIDQQGHTISVSISVKSDEPLDKLSGKALFPENETEGTIKGTYDPVFDTIVATIKIKKKNKVITGYWDEERDVFLLTFHINKKKAFLIECPRKNKKGPLSGKWVVNDSSVFTVELTEQNDGAITGKTVRGFPGATLEGTRNDNDVEITFSSPNDNPVLFNLKICASGETMAGFSSNTTVPDVLWCRKSRATDSICSNDATCTPFD